MASPFRRRSEPEETAHQTGRSRLARFPDSGRARLRRLERFQAKHALGFDPGVETGTRQENASNQESGAGFDSIETEKVLVREAERQCNSSYQDEADGPSRI